MRRQRATRRALRLAPGIVVGLDDHPASRAALRWAAAQSRMTGLPLRVVHTWQLGAMAATAMPSGSGAFAEAAAADARAHATRWVRETLGEDIDSVTWTLDITEGAPGPALVARSAGASLLVLGTREHTGVRRAVLGSVSHYCLSHSSPPVVAVPSPLPEATGTAARRQLAGFGPLL